MSDKEKDTSEKQDKKNKEKSKMDKELRQTFPASDPPSRSRPGHAEEEDDDES